ncbi:hypothetical protein [Lacticaseibacillus hegangensis]|uniref:hypothetical protein n=1 Tax=Lacticaseibacillus hegangensis TaxID=2486010 RepID=UPI0013DDFC28|nr:hypothetical protein [Lacticaseibacillus hegangensis]
MIKQLLSLRLPAPAVLAKAGGIGATATGTDSLLIDLIKAGKAAPAQLRQSQRPRIKQAREPRIISQGLMAQ